MWPFRKKPVDPAPMDMSAQAIASLREWRPIGGEFTYCGRTCVVCGHSVLRPGPSYSLRLLPQLSADYADDNGKIRCLHFSLEEARGLMASQP